MNILNRIYPSSVVEAEMEVLTPMFLGGADHKKTAQWRSASIKGAVRFWWRVAYGSRYANDEKLFAQESELFGAAGEKGEKSGRSLLTIHCDTEPHIMPQGRLDSSSKYTVKKQSHSSGREYSVKFDQYLAGQGISQGGRFSRPAISPGKPLKVRFELVGSADQRKQINTAIALFLQWGALGNRQRHGFGSFQHKPGEATIEPDAVAAIEWTKAFNRDYPHAFGKDEKGLLAWRSSALKTKWQDVLGQLGQDWYEIRHHFILLDTKNPKTASGEQISERLVVGGLPMIAPDKKIPPSWKKYRHGSPLRLMVRQDGQGCLYGIFYLLPHKLPDGVPQPSTPQQQTLKRLIQFMDNRFSEGRISRIFF